jgi:serine/alanine adding enzyme
MTRGVAFVAGRLSGLQAPPSRYPLRAHGKPCLPGREGNGSFQFSLSHSGAYTVGGQWGMENLAKVKILESGEEARWDKFVAAHRFGTIYHTSLWKKIIEDSYGHSSFYLYREDQNGNIKFGLPLFEIKSRITGNRLSCLPCAQECNPLVSDQAEIDYLIRYANELKVKRNCASIELKTSENFPFLLKGFIPSYDKFCTFILNLDPELDEIRKTFHKNIKRVLNKLPQSNLVFEDHESEQAIRQFYQLYVKMRIEKGLLPQPIKFFLFLWKTLAPVHNVKFSHARH